MTDKGNVGILEKVPWPANKNTKFEACFIFGLFREDNVFKTHETYLNRAYWCS
ncbi:MAG: hypothetical protein RL407_2306 [Bacteroidota bacterium]